MPPGPVLFLVYVGAMGVALACFLVALARRKQTPVHKKWALRGVVLDLGGTVAVLVAYRAFGWALPTRAGDAYLWHRGFAYASTALVLVVAFTGWKRIRVHHVLGPAFLVTFVVAYALAVYAYWPW